MLCDLTGHLDRKFQKGVGREGVGDQQCLKTQPPPELCSAARKGGGIGERAPKKKKPESRVWMGPGRAGMAPTSRPGWVRNAVKQSTWRIWTGPLRTQDGTWTGPGSDPGEGLDRTPRDSNRLLGVSE